MTRKQKKNLTNEQHLMPSCGLDAVNAVADDIRIS